MAKLKKIDDDSWQQFFVDRKKEMHLWPIQKDVKSKHDIHNKQRRVFEITFDPELKLEPIRQEFTITSSEIAFPVKIQNFIKPIIKNNQQSYFIVKVCDLKKNIKNKKKAKENDLGTKCPKRKMCLSERVIRCSSLAKRIKRKVGYRCQLCGIRIQKDTSEFYIEAHHIKPLGKPYNGPDIAKNILIVCPNCHLKCDYKIVRLSLKDKRGAETIKNNVQKISQEYVDFHNDIYEVELDT